MALHPHHNESKSEFIKLQMLYQFLCLYLIGIKWISEIGEKILHVCFRKKKPTPFFVYSYSNLEWVYLNVHRLQRTFKDDVIVFLTKRHMLEMNQVINLFFLCSCLSKQVHFNIIIGF